MRGNCLTRVLCLLDLVENVVLLASCEHVGVVERG